MEFLIQDLNGLINHQPRLCPKSILTQCTKTWTTKILPSTEFLIKDSRGLMAQMKSQFHMLKRRLIHSSRMPTGKKCPSMVPLVDSNGLINQTRNQFRMLKSQMKMYQFTKIVEERLLQNTNLNLESLVKVLKSLMKAHLRNLRRSDLREFLLIESKV